MKIHNSAERILKHGGEAGALPALRNQDRTY